MKQSDVCGPELLRVYALQSLDGLGFQSDDAALVRAAGSLIQYLGEIRPAGVTHLKPVRIQRPGGLRRGGREITNRIGSAGGQAMAGCDLPPTWIHPIASNMDPLGTRNRRPVP